MVESSIFSHQISVGFVKGALSQALNFFSTIMRIIKLHQIDNRLININGLILKHHRVTRQQMNFTAEELKRVIAIKDLEMSSEERREMHGKWKIMKTEEHLKFLHQELHSIIVTLQVCRILNQQKLSKVLSLNVTLQEAMALKLTNYYAYLMDLIRKLTISTSRNFLNRLSEQISKYQDMLHKRIEKQVERYRKLDDNQDQQEQEEKSVPRSNYQKSSYQSSYEINNGRRMIREQIEYQRQGSNLPIFFNRITKL